VAASTDRSKIMKTIIALSLTLVLLVTIGLRPISTGVKGGALHETNHMNRVSNTLPSLDSGSDGVGNPSFDRGYNSWFN
jgi:hypothetical protein